MSFFGGSILPSYGPGEFISGMGDLDLALAQNAALGASKPKTGGFGNFLKAWAGNVGDYLAGNNNYAASQQQMADQQAQMEWYARKREDEIADYERKKEIDARYQQPDYEGSIDHFNQAKQLGFIPPDTPYPEFLKMISPGSFVPPAPVVLPYNAEPISGGAGGAPGGGGIPRVTNQAEYEAVQPGGQYTDPQGNVRVKPKGGQSAGPTGGFPY